MNVDDAKTEITKFFQKYGATVNPAKLERNKGKAYELYCLGKVVEFLKGLPGVSVRYVGNNSIDFKASPGKIDRGRSYFVVVSRNGQRFELHTDIEVMTLSSTHFSGVTGKSAHHEIDLLLVLDPQDGKRTALKQVVLGVECKAHNRFEKGIVRQVLGMRRELSFFRSPPLPSLLSLLGSTGSVNAKPPSEFWLAFSDPRGTCFRSGPKMFGIEFKHWCP